MSVRRAPTVYPDAMTSRPHDALFKETFSDVDNARGELMAVLPPDVVAMTDWSTLALQKGSFVDEALRERLTDLLFSVRIRGREARLYLLFEHQSSPDDWMPLRALAYVVRIWEQWLATNKTASRLPPVIPVLLAQLDGGWRSPTSLAEIIDFADEAERDAIGPWVPQCSLRIDDLAGVTNDTIDAREIPPKAKLTLAALRDVRGHAELTELLASWARWIRGISDTREGEAAFMTLMRYILYVRQEVDMAAVQATVRAIDARAGETVMSMAEKLIAEGEAKGRVEGRVEGRAETLLKLLRLRFTFVPDGAADRVVHADAATLDRWVERVLTAGSVDDVLAD